MQSQRSSRGIQRPQLAIVQTVFQVPVVQLFLQQYEDDRQQLARRRADGLTRPLLPLLLLVEPHQRSVRALHHRQHRLDDHGAQPLPAPLRDPAVPDGLARLPRRGRQPRVGD